MAINQLEKSKDYEQFNSISFRTSVDILKEIQNKGVIVFGASGVMGSAISSTFPKASMPVVMQDIDKEKLELSKQEALKTLEKAQTKRKLSKAQLDIIKNKSLIKETVVFPNMGKIPFEDIYKAYFNSPEDAKELVSKFLYTAISSNGSNDALHNKYCDVMMVLEAGPELLTFKQNIFQFFDLALNSNKTILATNTSSLIIEEIASNVSNHERVVGFHYFLPADRNSLVEIIATKHTSIEVIQAMQNLAISMGKKPIISWGDSSGAVANRILVGLLNEAAKILDEKIATIEFIDHLFLEVFYSKQIKVQTKKAKRQFEAAPKLSFFNDESTLYKKIKKLDDDLHHTDLKEKINKILKNKKEFIEKAESNLRQKMIYTSIVGNMSRLGSFFKSALVISLIKNKVDEQLFKIRKYLKLVEADFDNLKLPFEIEAYDLYDLQPIHTKNPHKTKELIIKRFQGAYITIAQGIYKEGLACIQDIELACKEGFKYNIGPFELMKSLKPKELEEVINLVTKNLPEPTGISKPGEIVLLEKNNLSGIQTYIQNNIGFITLGRLHIQNLQMVQNSLSPEMLEAIIDAIKDFESKKVKAIIFKSQGGGAFCSGADLNYIESTKWNVEKILKFRNLGKQTMETVANCKLPTVAIIDGGAVGGGLELALACDYRIMTDTSFVAMPEVGLGIIPDWGGTERLPAAIGKELAKRLICTATIKNLGLKLSGEDAFTVGLADFYTLQSNLPFALANLIEDKYPAINIFVKPSKKTNYDKKDYPENIIKRFGLNKKFVHSDRNLTMRAAKLAEDLINHSNEPEYSIKANTDKAFLPLIDSGKAVSNCCIKPFLYAAQNKLLAPLFEKIGLL